MISNHNQDTMSQINAHAISEWTLLGYTSAGLDYYVDYNNNVRRLDTGAIVAENITNVKDAEKLTIGSPVYGKDLWRGIDMTVKSEDQTLSTNIGIAINQMTVDKGSWNISKHLDRRVAVKLVHKWFIEHKWLALYNKQTEMTPIRAFIHWLGEEHFGKLSRSDKLCWYNNAMKIDFEMEHRGCSFEDCRGDIEVPHKNPRHVIPWQYYDDFGLFNEAQRNAIWAEGKPESEEEANMLLHMKRHAEGESEMKNLIAKTQLKRHGDLF